jgi:hypothetical protein
MTIISRHDKPRLVVHDPNDAPDTLDCTETFGFGEPMLAVFVTQDDVEAGINLTLATARELRDYLNAFLWRHDDA